MSRRHGVKNESQRSKMHVLFLSSERLFVATGLPNVTVMKFEFQRDKLIAERAALAEIKAASNSCLKRIEHNVTLAKSYECFNHDGG